MTVYIVQFGGCYEFGPPEAVFSDFDTADAYGKKHVEKSKEDWGSTEYAITTLMLDDE